MIDFLKYRTLTAITSLVFIAAATYGFFTKDFTYSVDFTGGTQIQLGFSKPTAASQVIASLEQQWDGLSIREFSPTELLVRVKDVETDAKGLGERVKQTLENSLDDTQVSVLMVDSVTAGVGKKLREDSTYAVLLALFLMLVYIAVRFFSLGYALGAVVALFHDAVVILAFFLFFDLEISINVLGAILATLGYSINDTIVIFSKIRENLRKMKGVSVDEVVNVSINQTLRRTLLTSLSTALVVGSLLVLGGEVLRNLSIALLLGIVFGTYSSVYIASPVMLLLYKDKR